VNIINNLFNKKKKKKKKKKKSKTLFLPKKNIYLLHLLIKIKKSTKKKNDLFLSIFHSYLTL